MFYSSHPLIKHLLDYAARNRFCASIKKEPLTPEILRYICEHANLHDLTSLRDVSMMLLGYSGFLRFNELVNLKLSDLHFYDDYLKLIIRKAKTDQLRRGNEVLIARSGNPTCPVGVLERYILLAEIRDKDFFVFRPTVRSRTKCSLVNKNKCLSYTRARECFLKRLQGVPGCSGKNFGLHSLRSGGATAAASSGANERRWKRHGRWRSDSSKDRYVEDSIHDRLEISRCLGI